MVAVPVCGRQWGRGEAYICLATQTVGGNWQCEGEKTNNRRHLDEGSNTLKNKGKCFSMCIFCKTNSRVREDDWKCLSNKSWSMEIESTGLNFTNNGVAEGWVKGVLGPDHLVLDLSVQFLYELWAIYVINLATVHL